MTMIPVRSADGLMELGTGYQRSMILFVALRLGIFEALSGRPAAGRVLARRLDADPGRLAVLLDALAALGLLRKEGERYANADVASRFLLPGDLSKASLLLHHRDGWSDWGRLERTIRAGRRGRAKEDGFRENFIRGMEDNSRERAEAVAELFPLRPGDRVLDLGGGAGTYAVAWARRYPGADVTLFDTEATLRVTRKILKEKGAAGLVRLKGGDFLEDSIGGPYDFIWVSHVLHAFPEEKCLLILRRTRRALAPGGRAAVQEFLLGEDRASPLGPALFSVHMAAVTEGGRAYTAGEVAAMLERTGFREIAAGAPDGRGVGILTARARKGKGLEEPR
jgi:ubiquinone/menaquinone biosynthesis C-methylase UbiE